MTLPRFLDCAYVLLVDEYQRAGQDLLTATEKLAQWAPQAEEHKVENVAAKNTQAIQDLQSLMMGVQKR